MPQLKHPNLKEAALPANRFQAFRERHELSLRSLAKVFGLSRTSAHRLCGGEPETHFINRNRAQMEHGARLFLAGRKLSAQGVAQELAELFQTTTEETPMIIPRCELTKAAMKFHGLKKDPFAYDPESSEEYFFPPELDKVYDRAEATVEKRRFMAIVGEIGSGKSTLRHRLQIELSADPTVRMIWLESGDFEELRFADLTTLILLELGHTPKRIRIERAYQLTTVLKSLNDNGIRVTLAIDEAHRLSDKALSALKLFWEKGQPKDGGYNRYLGVLLFGQPQLETRLQNYQFREVVERLQIERMPKFEKLAGDYLAHRLKAVGGDINNSFAPEAVAELAKQANTPLALGNLANAALMAAYSVKEKRFECGMLDLDEREPAVRAVRRAR
ncbi:MAG TPA: AAA family ATPase [Blastocatellia bacterium]|nr:AAA family ATPase [Blastocatellia bacterium]HMV81785.1 AAA family ATPase [Blastocatellia bacterium]HMX24735.1 AAA family ATPase [Blastocatellia bacterium]HMY70684.1 AAA family ATPase [Blastocatellia bacterium]HMZ16473.1 AAA family ATPase [Blastocatellia bacterium]